MVSSNTNSTGNKRVLVVDDEEIVRDSCWRVLTDAGYTVRTVSNGKDALRACRSEEIDVLLTDIRMPDMDGLEVARTIRREFPDVRVLIITGYPNRESAEQADKLGIFDYLEKPLVPSRLSDATAAALASPPRRLPPELFTETPPADAASAALSAIVENPVSPAEAGEQEGDATASATPDAAPRGVRKVAHVLNELDEALTQRQRVPRPQSSRTKASPVKTLILMALSPLLGLALVVFLPMIGFGMLFAALGSALFGKRRSAQL